MDTAKIIAESGPLKCECGNSAPEEFAFVEWEHTLVAACKKCSRTYDYDKEDLRGTWKPSPVGESRVNLAKGRQQ